MWIPTSLQVLKTVYDSIIQNSTKENFSFYYIDTGSIPECENRQIVKKILKEYQTNSRLCISNMAYLSMHLRIW